MRGRFILFRPSAVADDISIMERVRAAAAKRILFLPHAIKAMVRVHPMITPAEVRAVVTRGDVVEDFRKMFAATVA